MTINKPEAKSKRILTMEKEKIFLPSIDLRFKLFKSFSLSLTLSFTHTLYDDVDYLYDKTKIPK